MRESTKLLDWQPIPDRAPRSHDVMAVRGAMTWTIKKANMNHSTFYVVRLNNSVVSRQETLRLAQQRAEQLCADREAVR